MKLVLFGVLLLSGAVLLVQPRAFGMTLGVPMEQGVVGDYGPGAEPQRARKADAPRTGHCRTGRATAPPDLKRRCAKR